MKTIRFLFGTTSVLLACCFIFSSFSKPMGAEGFEIYLNSKLLLRQFGTQMNDLKSIQLDQGSVNDELTIKYYHCGQVGKDRSLTIKDQQGKILKEWHFADVSAGKAEMICKVKDIVGLKKSAGAITLSLYYSCNELPKGRQLVSLVVGSQNMAKN